ncbi:MAG: dTDP-4-dehydrorhamnose reductase [Chitinophagales bacterium]|nr:dTDP-4-dehydrorhamnose reductase [Chitinophagales bacterium]
MNPSVQIKIAILGANGQLGQTFSQIATEFPSCIFEFYSKEQLNILDKNALIDTFSKSDYQYLINCAAYTNVDRAETESELCMAINADSCQHIIEAIKDTAIRLIHFSTDYLYHQYGGFALQETDKPNPQGVYARSKLAGEHIIRNSNIPALILRTSWVYSPFGHNFVKTMLRLGNERATIQVVHDQFGAPTYAKDLARAVLSIIILTERNPQFINTFNDTYNFANEGLITWYDFAKQVIAIQGLPCQVQPIVSKDYPTAAKRPPWSLLAKHKIKHHFHLEIPHWYASLKACLQEIQSTIIE